MAALDDYFSVQVFFIVLRETIESAIIISVLLAFLHQSFVPTSTETEPNQKDRQKELKKLSLHVYVGGLCGFLVCLFVGAIILSVFYIVGSDLWALTEHYWECVFSILASIIISVMGIKILRVTKMQQKWRLKLGHVMKRYSLNARAGPSVDTRAGEGSEPLCGEYEPPSAKAAWTERNAMFLLPFVTTLREGLEAIVFVGGIGINENTSIWSILNATILAMVIGTLVGVVLYRSGNTLSLRVFLLTSTCFLYLVAAGLFSKGVWNFELQRFIDACDGFDVSETGHGPGSYDIATSVWHVNCCNGEMPEDGLGWMLFTAVFGWTNSATYGSVIAYNVYWIVVIAVFISLAYEERKGYLPVPLSWQRKRMEKRQLLSLHQESELARASVDSTTPLTTR